MTFTFFDFMTRHGIFFFWRDCVEIGCITAFFYSVSLWLKKDTQKNLLAYFYLYAAVACVAYFLQLTTLVHLLFLFSPVMCMIFIIMHQVTLQKNFIALRSITHQEQNNEDWLEQFMQQIALSLMSSKEVIGIIEYHDSLHDFVLKTMSLDTPIKKELLEVILESPLYDASKLLMIHHAGLLLGINGQWKQPVDDTWLNNALFITSKIDALVFKTNPNTRTIDIVIQGKLTQNLLLTQARNYIKYCSTQKSTIKKEVSHAFFNQKESHQQPHR